MSPCRLALHNEQTREVNSDIYKINRASGRSLLLCCTNGFTGKLGRTESSFALLRLNMSGMQTGGHEPGRAIDL